MASCSYCNTTLVFGGKKDGNLRYCNAKCQENNALANFSNQFPQAEVEKYLGSVHRGNCPKCSGPGPVDVHTSYRVWSALFLTSWSSRPAICCQTCGHKKMLGDAVFSLFLGWWGFPWGILITPVQIVRNIVGLFRKPDPSTPSPALEKMIRLNLAAQALASRRSDEPSV